MAARGVHFALTEDQYRKLTGASDDDARMEIIEEIEESWDEDNLAQSDKAWDAIHRCLTDGELTYEGGTYPLNHVVIGGDFILDDDDEYVACLVTPEQVPEVAQAVGAITREQLRRRYDTLIDPDDYDGEIGDEDFDYTWEWFTQVRDLFTKAAQRGRAVLFTVAQ